MRTHNQQASLHFFLSASAVHQEGSIRAGSCTTFGQRQLQFIRLGMQQFVGCHSHELLHPKCEQWELQGDSVEPGATGERCKEVETDCYQKMVSLIKTLH